MILQRNFAEREHFFCCSGFVKFFVLVLKKYFGEGNLPILMLSYFLELIH